MKLTPSFALISGIFYIMTMSPETTCWANITKSRVLALGDYVLKPILKLEGEGHISLAKPQEIYNIYYLKVILPFPNLLRKDIQGSNESFSCLSCHYITIWGSNQYQVCKEAPLWCPCVGPANTQPHSLISFGRMAQVLDTGNILHCCHNFWNFDYKHFLPPG